jgi:NADH-quinone oxidoreductase subunit D
MDEMTTTESMERASGGLQTEEMVLNMGPQHPSTHGVLRLELVTDGEVVTTATPHIGYLHRCAEKIGENVTYPQFVPYTDRMDYLAGMNCNHGYALAVERLMGLQVPERAEYLRVFVLELNRIASHLVAWGTYGNDTGAFTPFFYAFRERERILDLFEELCGARLTYNYVRIGGVMADLTPGWLDKLRRFLDYFEPKIDEYNELLSYNKIFIKRLANIGVLPAELAIAYGVTGPNLRGSGVKWDVRKGDPYSIYDRFDFDVPVGRGAMGTRGDCWDRYMVRIEEMRESVKILRQAAAGLPAGPILAEEVGKSIKVPAGELYTRVENPRGELGFWIVAGGKDTAIRVKVRAPSFCSMSVFKELSRGAMIADLVAILGSFDIVLGEIDR